MTPREAQLEAQVTELREAFDIYRKSPCFAPWGLHPLCDCPDCTIIRVFASASPTGKEHYQKKLDEVNEVLKVLDKVDPYIEIECGDEYLVGAMYHPPLCLACQSEPHTETCELSALKKKCESKQKVLMKALRRMG